MKKSICSISVGMLLFIQFTKIGIISYSRQVLLGGGGDLSGDENIYKVMGNR